MTLIGRIIRAVLGSLSAELVIFRNRNCSRISRTEIAYLCYIVKFIVFIFLYSVNILGNINACFFF